MIDYRLRFTDEAEAQAMLFEPEDIKKPKYTYIDTIGIIYKPTGKMVVSEFGGMPEMAPVDGWHVNVRHADDAPELDKFVVQVNTPVRVWL
jgi:hypothetical protein